jgi:CelD/BcsL family acetyltransferase involved in cellulose biosynthesis
LRNNVRRDEKRLRERGSVEYIRYRPAGTAYGDDDPRWDLYETCVELAAASWQGQSDTGTTLSHKSVAEFFRDAHEAAVKNGMVDINILKVNGRAVAFSYNYICDGRLVGVRRGHLPQFTNCGIGNILLVYMLRDSFQREDRHLDLGTGYSEGKRRWSTRSARSYRYTHYPLLAPRAQILRLKHWATADAPATAAVKSLRSKTAS